MTGLPQPIKPYQNPIDAAAEYASQVLSGIGAGGGIRPAPRVKAPFAGGQANGLPQRTLGDRQKMIQDSASRQHQSALRSFQRSTQLSLPQNAGGGRTGGGRAAPRGGYTGAFSGGRNGLTPQAGAALDRLNAAYRQRFGTDIPIASGGRSRENQAYLYALYRAGKGNLAAPPGSSVHESGRAVDFGGAAHNRGTPQNTWLKQNAGQFGWLWTGKNFSQVEDWHFEYQG